MRNPIFLTGTLLALSASLAAQTDVVLPSAFATQMGSTANRIPHARHLTKYQQVFLGSEILGGAGMLMTSLSLREDEQFVGSAGTYDYTIRVGPTQLDHTSLTSNFAGNFSGPATTVFSGSFNLPASAGAGGVNSWLMTIPFTTNYLHQSGDNLLVEWTNSSAASNSSFLDFCLNDPGCTTASCYAFDPNATTATSLYTDRGLIMRFSGSPLATAGADPWSEDFDSYAANQVLDNVGGWFGWDNIPANAGVVNPNRSRSAPHSIHLGAATDAVHPGLGITAGKWRISGWQFIPSGGLSGGDAFFIVNNNYNHGGPYNWTTQLRCDAASGTVVDDLRPHTARPVAFDRWVEYRLDVDLDANTCSSYYDGALLSVGTWTGPWFGTPGPVAIEAIDLFNSGGVCDWDDVAVEWRGDGFDTYPANAVLDDVAGWFGWDNVSAAAGRVDATRARTGAHSLLVGGTTDAVHPGIGIGSGQWVFTAWQYIPTGGLAGGDVQLIMNNVYSHGGPYHWTGELWCRGSTGQVSDQWRTSTPQPIVFDQWVEFRLEIDLDANLVKNYYNGGLVSQGPYAVRGGPAVIETVDLWSTGGTCNWDDFCFREVTVPPCYETRIGTALGAGDDTVHAVPLGFSFPFPGGSTTDISICSNGFLWLDGVTTDSDYSPSAAEFLGSATGAPRIAACWRDFNPADPLSDDVYFNVFPDRAVITWNRLVRYQGTTPMTVQCQLLADGSAYVYYGAGFDPTTGQTWTAFTLTGIKAGVGAVADPGSTDYSATLPIQTGTTVYEYFNDPTLFDLQARCVHLVPNPLGGYDAAFRLDCGATTASYGLGCPAASPLALTTSGPPILGSSFTWDVSNMPSGSLVAIMLLGFGNSDLNLDFLGWTGCTSYTTLDVWAGMLFTPPTASLPFTVPVTPTILGLSIYSQSLVILSPTAAVTSNGLRLEFGKN